MSLTPMERAKSLMASKGEELVEEYNALNENSMWITENYQRLLELYPEQFVCVWGKRVMASSKTIEELKEKLKGKVMPGAVIEPITSKKVKLLFQDRRLPP